MKAKSTEAPVHKSSSKHAAGIAFCAHASCLKSCQRLVAMMICNKRKHAVAIAVGRLDHTSQHLSCKLLSMQVPVSRPFLQASFQVLGCVVNYVHWPAGMPHSVFSSVRKPAMPIQVRTQIRGNMLTDASIVLHSVHAHTCANMRLCVTWPMHIGFAYT